GRGLQAGAPGRDLGDALRRRRQDRRRAPLVAAPEAGRDGGRPALHPGRARRRGEVGAPGAMRRRLALLVVSVTAMVSVAALLPLAFVVTVVARDRAMAVADEESRTLSGVLAALSDPSDVGSVLDQLNAGNPRSSAVFLA